jgi:hypothetical protein
VEAENYAFWFPLYKGFTQPARVESYTLVGAEKFMQTYVAISLVALAVAYVVYVFIRNVALKGVSLGCNCGSKCEGLQGSLRSSDDRKSENYNDRGAVSTYCSSALTGVEGQQPACPAKDMEADPRE